MPARGPAALPCVRGSRPHAAAGCEMVDTPHDPGPDPEPRRPAGRWTRRAADRPDLALHLRLATTRWGRPSPARRCGRSIRAASTRPSRLFEDKLAALEGAEDALGFASGMAAISSAVLALRRARRPHRRGAQRLSRRLPPVRDAAAAHGRRGRLCRRRATTRRWSAALPGAKLLYLESPTSWVFEAQDVARSPRSPARAGAVTHHRQQLGDARSSSSPLALGVDLVVHSASKYLGGHSDVVAGVVAGSARADRPHPPTSLSLSRRQAVAVRRLAAGPRPAHAAAPHAARTSGPRLVDRAAPGRRIRRSRGCIIPASTPPGRPGARRHLAACSPSSSTRRHRRRAASATRCAVQARRELGRAREPGRARRGRAASRRRGPNSRASLSASARGSCACTSASKAPRTLWCDLTRRSLALE